MVKNDMPVLHGAFALGLMSFDQDNRLNQKQYNDFHSTNYAKITGNQRDLEMY